MREPALVGRSLRVADFTVVGLRQERSGSRAISRRLTANLFRTNDILLPQAVHSDRQYNAPLRTIAHAEMLDDPRVVAGSRAPRLKQLCARSLKSGCLRACRELEGPSERCRRPVCQHLAYRGSYRPAADRRVGRQVDCRDPVWPGASNGLALFDGAWAGRADRTERSLAHAPPQCSMRLVTSVKRSPRNLLRRLSDAPYSNIKMKISKN